MRVVVQRVKSARVEVDAKVRGEIGGGLVVLVGVAKSDTRQDAEYLADKIAGLRVLPDEEGRMNRSVAETGGGVLVVSQFTLYGDVRRGRRPGFERAAGPELARDLYEHFVQALRLRGLIVETGVFQADMAVYMVNHGPVTIIIDSEKIV